METVIRRDKESRTRLADFMILLSNGYTISPYTSIIDLEIKNAVYKRLGLPIYNIREKRIKEGISNLLGAEGASLKGNISPLMEKTLLRLLESKAMLRFTLINDTLSSHEKAYRSKDDLVQKLEKIREENSKIKDKNLRDRYTKVLFFRDVISKKLAKLHLQLGITKETIIKKDILKEEIERFLEDIPSAYISHLLANERDKQMQRKIKKNDMNDIATLSMAIPYCDIVVAENMFTSIAKNLKLDEKYSTIILSNPKDVIKYL